MIPQRRFATLLDQARAYQQSQCLYHNVSPKDRSYSLYTDHLCDRDAFPRVTTTILQVHTDEVWNLEWSHSGRYLATASKDKSAIIWRVEVGRLCVVRQVTVLTRCVGSSTRVHCQEGMRRSSPYVITHTLWVVWHGH